MKKGMIGKSKDAVVHSAKWRLWKWRDPNPKVVAAISAFMQQGHTIEECIAQFGVQPEFTEWEGNVALNEGLANVVELICGISTPAKWDAANARLGVGNSSTAANSAQTALLGASKTFKAMVATYPQRSGQTAIWRSQFDSAEANYAWEEYTVVNAADDTGQNLNRKVEPKGTKASGETWTLELQIAFS